MTKKMLKRKDFIKHLSEFEGIDLNITGDDNEEFSQYDGGCNIGKLSLNARVVKLLERLELYQKIQPERVYIEMPLGATRGDVLITCESDIRMGTLRKMRNESLVINSQTLHGYKVWLSPELEEHIGHNAVKVTGFYVFEKAMVTTTEHPQQGEVFDVKHDMRLLWLVAEAAKTQLIKDDVVATLKGDTFTVGEQEFKRYVSRGFGL